MHLYPGIRQTRLLTKGRDASVAPVGVEAETIRVWWVVGAALIWFTMGVLKVQVARVVPFDIVILGLFALLFLARWMPGHRGRPGQGRGQAPAGFYIAQLSLLCAGLLSGIHAINTTLWGLELATIVYMAVMVWTLDGFIGQRVGAFMKVGAWAFAALSLLCGLAAVLYLIGGVKIGWFFEVNPQGVTEKFVGTTRFPNQWSAFFVALFPMLLALCFSQQSRGLRAMAVVCALAGALTVPASGSRSGMFLMVAELVGFIALMALTQRGEKAMGRWLDLSFFVGLFVLAYVLFFDQIGDSSIVQRAMKSFDLVFEQRAISDDWRTTNWALGLKEYLDHPITGIGLGSFRFLYDKHEIHSSYISLLVETGLIGFVAFTGLIVWALLRLSRALLVHAAHRKADVWLIGLFVALVACALFGFYHNNTRHRFLWCLLLCGVVYARHAVLALGAAQRPPYPVSKQRHHPKTPG